MLNGKRSRVNRSAGAQAVNPSLRGQRQAMESGRTYFTEAKTERGESFRLSDVARVAAARMTLILVVTLCVVAVAGIAAVMLPTKYSASSVVMLDPRKNNVADVSAVVSELPIDPSTV